MTRKQERENAFIIAFEESFKANTLEEIIHTANEEKARSVGEYGNQLLQLYMANGDEIDTVIQSKLKGWSTERISRACLIIMRLAVNEMLYIEDVPGSVAINEAVELAKKYADEEDYQFVNGVLGAIAKEHDVQ